MSKTVTVYKEIEVDVSLSEFSTEDLISELEDRDGLSEVVEPDLYEIWQLRREGKPYDAQLDAYIYRVLGIVI